MRELNTTKTVKYTRYLLLVFILSMMSSSYIRVHAQRTIPEWSVTFHSHRLLVEVPPVNTGARKSDSLPASVKIDLSLPPFAKLTTPIDLDSIQVIRYDPVNGKPLSAPIWPFSRSQGERASRFLDQSLPWAFPLSDGPLTEDSAHKTFPRGAYLINVKGSGNPGLLTWDHQQDGQQSSFYAIYFDLLPQGQRQAIPRQGFIGDGSPRRDRQRQAAAGAARSRRRRWRRSPRSPGTGGGATPR